MQLLPRRQMLPAVQERKEFGGGDRLDFAAKPADREAVDSGQQTSMAPFELRAPCKLPT